MRFHKYHALGNDYIVLNPADFPTWKPAPTLDQIRVVCHRNFGVGSDGILWGPLPSQKSEFGLRIFNPDGSEAEKSGNGLRIFSRYLWDQKLVKNPAFTIEVPGGVVQSVILDNGQLIKIAMGNVSFDSAKIPVNLTVGASTDCSEIYLGNFADMQFIMRETVSVQLLRESFALTGQLAFVGHVRADVVVSRPKSFAIVTGVRA